MSVQEVRSAKEWQRGVGKGEWEKKDASTLLKRQITLLQRQISGAVKVI